MFRIGMSNLRRHIRDTHDDLIFFTLTRLMSKCLLKSQNFENEIA